MKKVINNKSNHKVILLFVDGVGIGKKDYTNNPFFANKYDFLDKYLGFIPSVRNKYFSKKDVCIFPVNARMGIAGLPQSGTGQTSIFCGINASKIVGHHFGPYPYSTLKYYLENHSVFIDLINKGKKVSFLNAYPHQFFEYIKSGKKRLSATTLMCQYANINLNGYEQLRNKIALSAELTNKYWIDNFHYDLDLLHPFEAGKVLNNITKDNDFVLFEYFLTDHAGHSRDHHFANEVLSNLFQFIEGIITTMDHNNTILLVVSDHGNIEDLSVKSHTLNYALGMAVGKYNLHFGNNTKYLYDIKNLIIDYFDH